MIKLLIEIILTVLMGGIAITVLLQLNTWLLLRQIHFFKCDKDPSEAFSLTIPDLISSKKFDKEFEDRG